MDRELKPWVPKLQETANNVKKVHGYFYNHFHGYAPCLQLLEWLGLFSPRFREGSYG